MQAAPPLSRLYDEPVVPPLTQPPVCGAHVAIGVVADLDAGGELPVDEVGVVPPRSDGGLMLNLTLHEDDDKF